MTQHEKLIQALINELSMADCFEDYENAGQLTYYLDLPNQAKPAIRLQKHDGTDYSEPFVLNNSVGMQIGYVMTNAFIEGGTTQDFGFKYRTTNVATRWDLLIFIHNPKQAFDLGQAIRAFNKVGLELLDVEVNPVQVVLRNGARMPGMNTPYPPDLRAYAFSYKIPEYPTQL